jgi:hypothetical protein
MPPHPFEAARETTLAALGVDYPLDEGRFHRWLMPRLLGQSARA